MGRMGQNHEGGDRPTGLVERRRPRWRGTASCQPSQRAHAHLTVIAFHVVVSVHGHHTDGCLTALEEEMGFMHNKQAGL